MDEILDEIDAVLEENAEEFVKSYVQKGGRVTERLQLPAAGTPFGSSPSFAELVRRERPEALPRVAHEAQACRSRCRTAPPCSG